MNKKFFLSRRSLLISIVIIASFLRLYNITQIPPGLYPDEAMNGNNALEALATGNFKVFYPENNGREGLFINIQAISAAIFGNEPWALRIISAVFGILTVLGVYFLTKELFEPLIQNSKLEVKNENVKLKINEKIALLSSFFLATSFWHINFSRIGFRAITAPFFLSWALYFLLKALNSIVRTSDVLRLNSREYLVFCILLPVFSGIFFGLGFHSYIAYRVMPLLILIVLALYWFKNKDWAIRKKIILIGCIMALVSSAVFLPLGLYYFKNPADFFGRTTQVSVFSSSAPFENLAKNILKTAAMFNFSGDWNWRHNYAGRPQLFWPTGIMFLTGIILGILSLFKTAGAKQHIINSAQIPNERNSKELDISNWKNRNLLGIWNVEFGILFSWLVIAALPVVISNEGIPHALRAIIMIPPVFILAGIGGIWIYEKLNRAPQLTTCRKKYKLPLVAGFLLLMILTAEAYQTYFIAWAKDHNIKGAFSADYAEIGRELNKLPRILPKYVIVEAPGVNVRGIPMPAQTVMFITDTFTPEKQKEKNIFYLLPDEKDKIPKGAYTAFIK